MNTVPPPPSSSAIVGSVGEFPAGTGTPPPPIIGRSATPSSAGRSGGSKSGSKRGRSKGAHYHCDYCRQDITNDDVRIKCADCKDFDLCVNCFSMGVSVPPHQNSHRYRVMEHVTGSIFHNEWGAEEELLLLEGIEMFGLGNWQDVGDHVGTKTKMKCENHYIRDYLDSPTTPLPERLLGDAPVREESQRVRNERPGSSKKTKAPPEEIDGQPPKKKGKTEAQQSESSSASSSSSSSSTSSKGAVPSQGQKGGIRPKENAQYMSLKISPPPDPRQLKRDEIHPSLLDNASLIGFMPDRGDFDNEWDNNAERILADMDFKDTDTEYETQLKLKVLSVYTRKLDERQKRKDFVIKRGLLSSVSKEKRKLSRRNRDVFTNMQPFARFHSPAEHQQFLEGLYNEQRLREKINRLQNYRMNGLRNFAEVEAFEAEKKRRLSSAHLRRNRELQHVYTQTGAKRMPKKQPTERDETGRAKVPKKGLLDISGFSQYGELTDVEKKLCAYLHLKPADYFLIKDAIAKEACVKGLLKPGELKRTIELDVNKSKNTFDFIVSTTDETKQPPPPTTAPPPTTSSSSSATAHKKPLPPSGSGSSTAATSSSSSSSASSSSSSSTGSSTKNTEKKTSAASSEEDADVKMSDASPDTVAAASSSSSSSKPTASSAEASASSSTDGSKKASLAKSSAEKMDTSEG